VARLLMNKFHLRIIRTSCSDLRESSRIRERHYSPAINSIRHGIPSRTRVVSRPQKPARFFLDDRFRRFHSSAGARHLQPSCSALLLLNPRLAAATGSAAGQETIAGLARR